MDPVARRIAETARPAAWLGLLLGRLGPAADRPASAFRVRRPASLDRSGRVRAVPDRSDRHRDTRGRTDQDPRQAAQDRLVPLARVLRVLRPSPAGPGRSRRPGGRARTVPGSLVRIRPRPARTGARLADRDPRRRLDTAARPRRWRASPARTSRAWLSRRERVGGERPWPERLRACRLPAACAGPRACSGPVRAGPVLFGTMLVRPVPVSAVLPGAVLFRTVLPSAVRLRPVLVRPVPAGVMLLRPVLVWSVLAGVMLLRSGLSSAVAGPDRGYCSGPGPVLAGELLRPVLVGPVPSGPRWPGRMLRRAGVLIGPVLLGRAGRGHAAQRRTWSAAPYWPGPYCSGP